MNEYTASNGIQIRIEDGHLVMTRLHDVLAKDADLKALREFFQAERDEALRIWRSDAHPGYLVHVHDHGKYVWVSKELGGNSTGAYYRGAKDTMSLYSGFAKVARAYFDAHPEPKPWHDAKPGEVWVLTVDSLSSAFYPSKSLDRTFTPVAPETGRTAVGMDSFEITAGRRIYPEGDTE